MTQFRDGPVILDGGLATELEARGCDISGALWSARVLRENPEAIEQLHYDYFAAGANVAITASYQASYEGFAALGIDADETTRLLRRSVELALGARDRFRRDHPERSAATCSSRHRSGLTARSRTMARSTAVTTASRPASSPPSIRGDSKCWPVPARICWPAKRSPYSMRRVPMARCSRATRARKPG